MSIRGITFVNQIVKSDDDASLHNMLLSGRSGVMRGCDTTFDSSHIYVASGQFVILGRQVEVQGTETIAPEAVTEGKKYCRLVFEIDLSKTNTIETFGQGYFKVLSSSVSYPDVSQEDLTAGGTVYQYPWAKFTQTVNGIANFSNDTTVLQFSVDEVLSAVSENPVQNKVVYEALKEKLGKTETAADSAKLGGKDASEYSLVSGTYLATSILDYALTLPVGEHFIRFSGDSYSGNDLPSSNYKYGTANINKRGSNAIEVILWGSFLADARKIAVNFYNGTSWVGWDTDAKTSDLANYLPLSGGTVISDGWTPLGVKTREGNNVLFPFSGASGILGYLAFFGENNPVFRNVSGSNFSLLHTGTSAPTKVQASAPSDTSAVWVW